MIKLISRYLKKYWYFAILAPLFMILEVTMDMIMNQYMEKIVDFGIQLGNVDNVIKYGIIMLVIVLMGVIFGVLSGVFTNITSFKCADDMRKETFSKIMYLSYHQTDKFSTGSLVTRVTNDITQIQGTIGVSLRMFVRAFSMFILGIIFTLRINVRFGIILLIVLPLEAILMLLFLKFALPIFKKLQKKLDKVNTVVHENVSGARVVKAFSKENYENERFKAANNELTSLNLKVSKFFAFLSPLMMLIIHTIQIVIYYIGGSTIFDSYISGQYGSMIMVGEITQAVTYIVMICSSMIMIGMLMNFFASASVSAGRINEVLSCEEEIIDGNVEPSKTIFGEVKFDNVSFHYHDTDFNVLNNLNFEIHRGETIAIVGSTGSGKSTVVNLITRFYDVTQGRILVDGIDVRDYRQFDLRNKVVICLQKAELFAGSMQENIRWGKTDATFEEVVEASEIAQAREFIESTPNKFDEYIEEKGASLSGGQKQRISIARAIIKKPEILIFDDATSALDLVTEAKLYAALRRKLPQTTKIMVAQRIATARNADKILVLDGGSIVGFDSHDNLMENCEVYKDIYNSQLKQGGVIDE